jgi:hypothetical protein
MKAKILVCALLALILPAIHLAEAQQPGKSTGSVIYVLVLVLSLPLPPT